MGCALAEQPAARVLFVLALDRRMVEEAIAEKITEIDLRRGTEAYKFDWTDFARGNVVIRAPMGWRGRLITRLWHLDDRIGRRRASA